MNGGFAHGGGAVGEDTVIGSAQDVYRVDATGFVAGVDVGSAAPKTMRESVIIGGWAYELIAGDVVAAADICFCAGYEEPAWLKRKILWQKL